MIVITIARLELGHCDRRCRLEFGHHLSDNPPSTSSSTALFSISGSRDFSDPDTCNCYSNQDEVNFDSKSSFSFEPSDAEEPDLPFDSGEPKLLGKVGKASPFRPPYHPKEEVCGRNGRNYASEEDAIASGTHALHGLWVHFSVQEFSVFV
jgi:hypothetical protein